MTDETTDSWLAELFIVAKRSTATKWMDARTKTVEARDAMRERLGAQGTYFGSATSHAMLALLQQEISVHANALLSSMKELLDSSSKPLTKEQDKQVIQFCEETFGGADSVLGPMGLFDDEMKRAYRGQLPSSATKAMRQKLKAAQGSAALRMRIDLEKYLYERRQRLAPTENRGQRLSFWSNWSDGKKWTMGILSSLFVAASLSLVGLSLRAFHSAPVPIPGDTGWVFTGYYDIARETFTEGPYVSVVSTTTPGKRRYVEVGDVIRLNVSRKVVIVNFATEGVATKLQSPITKEEITATDETGVTLPPETELVVRDVSEGRWPGNPQAALWLRVVHRPR